MRDADRRNSYSRYFCKPSFPGAGEKTSRHEMEAGTPTPRGEASSSETAAVAKASRAARPREPTTTRRLSVAHHYLFLELQEVGTWSRALARCAGMCLHRGCAGLRNLAPARPCMHANSFRLAQLVCNSRSLSVSVSACLRLLFLT